MKKGLGFVIVVLIVIGFVPATKMVGAMYGTKIIDGSLNDWTASDLVAIGRDTGLAGANLDKLYVAWDDQYLYIAIKTNNTGSWGVVYGIGIDVDPGTGNGYTFYDQDGNTATTEDMWWRNIAFGEGYAIDYEIYFWYDSGNDRIGGGSFGTWTGSGWSSVDINNVAQYAQTSGGGLQVIEIAIPWNALGGMPNKVAIISWISGGSGGDSAVDTLPADPAIDYGNISGEWTDGDVLTNLAEIYVGMKTIDGNLNDWSINELAAEDITGAGETGGNLTRLYVSWDEQYLYIAIETNNTENGGPWGMAYGFGIDVDPGTGNGYTSGGDAWGRNIEFSNGYAVDYEVYFWWDQGSASITTAQLNTYAGGWDWPSLESKGGKYAYTGNSTNGLKTLEIAIPWAAIGGMPKKFAIAAWVTGDSGSAVDILPDEATVTDSSNERTDNDIVTNMAEFEIFVPMPELTISFDGPTVVGINRLAKYNITIENKGSVSSTGVQVRVYINNSLCSNWTTDLAAGEKKWFLFNWIPNTTGTYTIRAVIDEDNLIAEVNENNNEVIMNVSVIWVGNIDVDGNPDDWPTVTLNPNSYTIQNGFFIWRDRINDQRYDKDPYLPGKSSSHADLAEVGVTKDDRYVYFLFKFANMSNIKIGDNGATFVAVPIDFKEGGANWLAGEMDMKSGIEWDIQFAVNLKSTEHSGEKKVVVVAGTNELSLLYFVDPEGNVISINDALVGINLDKNTIEVRMPLSVFEGAKEFKFQVVTGFSYGEGVWNFGDPFNNDEVSDAVDVITDKVNTLEEVKDGGLDYYILVSFNNVIESAKVEDIYQVRIAEENRKRLGTFMQIGKYYVPARVKNLKTQFYTLMKHFESARYPPEIQNRINTYNKKAQEILAEFNSTVKLINTPYYTISTAFKLFRLYIQINNIVKELKEIASVNYELMQNLTKEIDGNLDDWSPETLVYEDTTGFGQDGANLKALYVDYDDNFLYIALTTENKASWRIAYGFALDYKDGGYKGDTDGWGRKISFTRGVDAELYFWWFGEFFGEKGTDRIETMQLVLWNGTGWQYYNLQDIGFAAWTGSTNGLQTLEIAVPWDALGGKPEKIAIVAWITGANAGDSAVETLPDDPAVRDLDPGQEWTDADTISTFSEVTIR